MFALLAKRISVLGVLAAIIALVGCELPSNDGQAGSEYPFRIQALGELTLEQAESGILGRSDTINARDGSYYKVYAIEAEKDDLLRFKARSDAFTPVLSLFTLDGTPLGSTAMDGYMENQAASLIQKVTSSGRYLVVLSGNHAGDMGSFNLQMETLSTDGVLDFPGSVTGALYSGEAHHPTRGTPMRVYPISLEEDAALDIRLDSDDFDAYLTLIEQPNSRVVVEDDDSGEGLNARIMTRLPAGDYEILATSLGNTGMFTLSADIADVPEVPEFVFGESYQGHLGFNRQPVPDTHRTGQPLRFVVEERGELTATMTSMELDTYLVLTDDSNTVISFNDDAVDMGTNSKIVETLDPGEYVLWATSYGGNESGRFQIDTDLKPQPE
ncbi:hypothetical protein J2T60_000881 [Natronospira proteinivora]|uniref:Pre-peptidase n=1 Tax=Natronospira proteinivora TaxID=1807133 RepID=A0ABT1G6N5_9GAMM|nr:hypothetical protein [Natronospira proteinivora]MCP1726916.1 hypothetical protein [Natronospira proteinivora]